MPGKVEREDEERGVYIISVAAELAGVHPQTLRIYERKGLLQPSRTAGNTRRYSRRDIERLRAIQDLTQAHGINLAGVKMIVEMESELERLRLRMEELNRQLEAARRRLAHAAQASRQDPRRTVAMVPLSSIPRWPWQDGS